MQPAGHCFWHVIGSKDGLKETSCIAGEQTQWMLVHKDIELVLGMLAVSFGGTSMFNEGTLK